MGTAQSQSTGGINSTWTNMPSQQVDYSNNYPHQGFNNSFIGRDTIHSNNVSNNSFIGGNISHSNNEFDNPFTGGNTMESIIQGYMKNGPTKGVVVKDATKEGGVVKAAMGHLNPQIINSYRGYPEANNTTMDYLREYNHGSNSRFYEADTLINHPLARTRFPGPARRSEEVNNLINATPTNNQMHSPLLGYTRPNSKDISPLAITRNPKFNRSISDKQFYDLIALYPSAGYNKASPINLEYICELTHRVNVALNKDLTYRFPMSAFSRPEKRMFRRCAQGIGPELGYRHEGVKNIYDQAPIFQG